MLPLVAARREHTRGVPLCTSVREGVFSETKKGRGHEKRAGARGPGVEVHTKTYTQ